MQFKRMN